MAGSKPFQAFDAAILADRLQATTPRATEALEGVLRDCLGVMLSSFALAIAFAMGAHRKGQVVPLLVEWQTAISLRGPRANRSGAGSLVGLPLPGLSWGPGEADYFSRPVPENEQDSSETGIPPPP